MHRVTKIEGNTTRYIALPCYVLDPLKVNTPEHARVVYGKALPIHYERENIQGCIARLRKYMRKNISEADWKVRVDLAAMFRLTHMMGWDDTVWNHITARAPGTDHTFFMHQMGLLYEEVKASNLIKVDEEGKVLKVHLM